MADPTALETLKTTFDKRDADGGLTVLVDTGIPGGTLNEYLRRLPAGLGLGADATTSLQTDDNGYQQLEVTGTLRDPSSIAKLPGATVSGGRVRLRFDATNPTGRLSVDGMSIPLGSGPTAVTGVVTEERTLTLTIARIGLTEVARDIGGFAGFAPPTGFPAVVLENARLTVSTTGDGAPGFRASTDVVIGGGKIALAATPQFVPGTAKVNGFAVAMWADSWPSGAEWTLSSLWPPLSALPLDGFGLYICSTNPTPAQLPALRPDGWADASNVADRWDSGLRSGVTLLAFLRLDSGPLSWLGEVFGWTNIDLVATRLRDQATVVARASWPGGTGAFAFTDVVLTWTAAASAASQVTVTASGTLTIDDSQRLGFEVGGGTSSDGRESLTLAVQNWTSPFGYDRLTITGLQISIASGPTGIDVTLAGAFAFTTRAQKRFTFRVAAEIKNFDAPSALLFSVTSDSPGTTLTVGEMIEGITSIDTTNPTSAIGRALADIDAALRISEISFWAVVDDEAVIEKTTLSRGFGFHGDVTLFGRRLLLVVDVRPAEKQFSGRAELPAAVRFGSVLTLARATGAPGSATAATALPAATSDVGTSPAPPTTGTGPVLAVSSVIDDTHPHYLQVDARITLFDVVSADVVATVTGTALTFSLDIAARPRTAGSGGAAWAKQSISVSADRENAAFRTSLACDFGLQGVTLGGFDLFGLMRVPTVTIPDLRLTAGLDVSADATAGTMHVGGRLDFEFMGRQLHGAIAIDLTLADAPAALSGLGPLLLNWVTQNLETLLRAGLASVVDFTTWVKAHQDAFAGAATQVGHVLQSSYQQAAESAVGLLRTMGYPAAQAAVVLRDVYQTGSAVARSVLGTAGYAADKIDGAMRTVFLWTTAIVDAADQAFTGVKTAIDDFAGEHPVEMVLFNMTGHRLEVQDAKGNHLVARKKLVVNAGGSDTVATFTASTGRWGYVYLRDLDAGTDYQLYIELGSIRGSRYHGLDLVNPRADHGNEGPRPLAPAGTATSTWTSRTTAAFTLLRLPSDIRQGHLLTDNLRQRMIVAPAGAGEPVRYESVIRTTAPVGRLDARWRLVPAGGDAYHIIELLSGKAIVAGDVADGKVYLEHPQGRPNAEWLIEPARQSSGYTLVDRKHRLAIAAPDHATGPLRHLDPVGAAGVRWTISPRPRSTVLAPPTSFTPGVRLAGPTMAGAAARANVEFTSTGNLAVFDETGKQRWVTKLDAATDRTCVFQSDGNLVIYDKKHKAVWSSKSSGHPEAVLALQEDGDISIFDLTGNDADGIEPWAANTRH